MAPFLTAASLLSVKNWVVVVTGGGTGIGLSTTSSYKPLLIGRRGISYEAIRHATNRNHGPANVNIKYKIGSSGGQIVPLVLDVTSKDSIKNAVDHITRTDGYVNLLVNNAGVWTTKPEAGPEDGPEKFGSSMFDQSIDLWQQGIFLAVFRAIKCVPSNTDNFNKAFLVNATSIYFVTAAFLPLLSKSISSPTGKLGSVINTTSNSGQLRMSEASQLAYNPLLSRSHNDQVSKAASVQMTRQLAFDFSHEKIKIRVNGIAPGWFPSEMTTGGSDDNNESTSQEDSAFQQEMTGIGARVPPGRMGKSEDLASGLLTLATNDYIWGMNLVIDGGILQSVAGNI
ncbi:hypothetical protein N0V94_002959 [Neodidymelliopsis sp. IMI 364377]|nr:hypothetical protein N0V94_002959 [Neodidymelliopsis sp. IMI 364377]